MDRINKLYPYIMIAISVVSAWYTYQQYIEVKKDCGCQGGDAEQPAPQLRRYM